MYRYCSSPLRRRGNTAVEVGRGGASGMQAAVPNNQRGTVVGQGAAGKTSHSSLSELRRSPQPTTTTTATTTTTTASPEPQYTDPRLGKHSVNIIYFFVVFFYLFIFIYGLVMMVTIELL